MKRKIMKAKEVAELLNVSVVTVRKYAKHKFEKIEGVGRPTLYVDYNEVEKALRERYELNFKK